MRKRKGIKNEIRGVLVLLAQNHDLGSGLVGILQWSIAIVNNGGSISLQRILICKYCSKRHLGKCWKKSSACFKCGFVEHHVKDC